MDLFDEVEDRTQRFLEEIGARGLKYHRSFPVKELEQQVTAPSWRLRVVALRALAYKKEHEQHETPLAVLLLPVPGCLYGCALDGSPSRPRCKYQN